jgi:hypothetical protein
MAAAAGLALVVRLAQAAASPQAPPPVENLPVSVERIQQALAKPEPEKTVKIPTVFRVTVEGRSNNLLRLAPWDPANDSPIPPWVRPRIPLYHYEFLMMVTPEAFRAGVLFPISFTVPLDPLVDEIREAWQRRREARARREVDEALRQLLEARKKEQKK